MDKESNRMENPISEIWNIDVIYGYCKKADVKKFIIMFTDKVVGSENFILEWKEFRFDKKTVVERSGEIGIEIDSRSHTSILDYVNYLKLSDNVKKLDDKTTIDDYILRSNQSAINNASVAYEDLLECLEEDRDRFTTLKDGNFNGNEHLGCILDDEKSIERFGGHTVAIPNSSLANILGVNNKNELVKIKDIWSDENILIATNEDRGSGRLKNEQRICLNSSTLKRERACIIRTNYEEDKDTLKCVELKSQV